jgi:hypothetical protein
MLYSLSYGGSCGAVPLYPVPAVTPTLDRTARPAVGFAVALLGLALLPFAAAQPPDPPRFVAHTTDPTPLHGRLSAITDGWAVSLNDPNATVPAGHLVSLRREGRPLPPWPRGPVIVLANGDRIHGEVTGGDTRSLRFTPVPRDGTKSEPWAVPLTALAAVWVTPPPADTPPDPAAYLWADGPRRRDAVLLRNGDTLRGTVEGFAADPPAVRVKAAGESAATTLPLSRVAAVAFDPTLARARKPKGPFARLVTADGSRLSFATATADATTLKGTTTFGTTVEVPLADVVALDVLQGKATYLSDLKPKRTTVEGYNGVAWSWAADRTVKGHPLRLGSQTFDKGLGTHPRTTLVYDLSGKYRRFEALAGLDPVTGRRGAVEVRVLVDGRDGLTTALTAGTDAKAIAVDVARAKELTLVVDYGPGGDVQDDVNWGDARLIE